MRKNALLILAFALLVIAYGLSQYWSQNRSPDFAAVLLDFLPDEVNSIEIKPAGGKSYRLLRNQGRWLMSRQHVHEEVKAAAVEDLLQRLRSIRTSKIVTDQPKEWENYGLSEKTGLRICLQTVGVDKPICLLIGNYTYESETREIGAYTRLLGQREIYAINGLEVSILDGNPAFFRNRQLLQSEQAIERLIWKNDSLQQEICLFGTKCTGVRPTLADSLKWLRYTELLQDLKGVTFADDIDETRLAEKLNWSLQLYTTSDSLSLYCYRDSSRREPFILHSPQFPQTWISSDSSGVYQALAMPWQQMILTDE